VPPSRRRAQCPDPLLWITGGIVDG
jgi:hypothetical protein